MVMPDQQNIFTGVSIPHGARDVKFNLGSQCGMLCLIMLYITLQGVLFHYAFGSYARKPVSVYLLPRVGSGVVRMDPLHFLAGCRTR